MSIVNPPDFRILIEDLHAAEFWLLEWNDRYQATNDEAFKEQADEMRRYIYTHFTEWGDRY